MLVLGVDPGTRNLGWGLVSGQTNRMKHVAHGVVRASDKLPLSERLVLLEQGLRAILDEHRPDVGSVETLFFQKDPQAAAKLGHARGVVLLCLSRGGVDLAEYSPALVKSVVTGHGRAQKVQVGQMVKTLLCLGQVPPEDASDALALAITHLRRAPIDQRLAEQRAKNPILDQVLKRPRRRGAPVLRRA